MNEQEQKRVIALEAKYDSFKPRLEQLVDSLHQFQTSYQDYVELREFYGSQEWFDLREKPHDGIKAGILSEDLLYDLIVDHGDLLSEFLELSSIMYKHL